ncbi:MAG: carbohydrate kinase [Clostridia bacterium]|nr:carbohydrate kinase [Clostridia bacterium]MBQ5957072.1 carbohydrate kinase [Clostridia bacterium]MBR6823177.1 carbohydrate kinase [Clostridia bacterium]
MARVYCVGELLIDFIPGTEKDSYIKKAGGAPANVAVAVARNGVDASLACKVGNDDFGRFLLDTMKEQGVTVATPEMIDEAITTLAFVSLTPEGERSFTFARKPGADMFLKAEEIKDEDIMESDIIHAGSLTLQKTPSRDATITALRKGHEMGKLVSFDINYRPNLWNGEKEKAMESVESIFPYINMLKISDEETDFVGGIENIHDFMEKNDIPLVVETLGGEGSRAFFNGKEVRAEGFKAKVVDTTGAGDAFWGAFMACLLLQGVRKPADLTDEILYKALRYGNASGSICVSNKGAIASIPTREQIEELLGR